MHAVACNLCHAPVLHTLQHDDTSTGPVRRELRRRPPGRRLPCALGLGLDSTRAVAGELLHGGGEGASLLSWSIEIRRGGLAVPSARRNATHIEHVPSRSGAIVRISCAGEAGGDVGMGRPRRLIGA